MHSELSFSPEDASPLPKPQANLSVGGTDEILRAEMGFKEDKPADKETPAAATTAPPFIPVPAFDAQTFAQGIAMADDYRRQREMQEAQGRQYQERMAQVFQPPALPTGKDLEKLVADENALAAEFVKRDQWHQNSIQTLAQMMGEYVQQQVGQMQQQAMAPAMHLQRTQAMDEAAGRLEDMGIKNADEVVSLLEQRLRGNPQQYWRTVTDPYVLTQGARLVADDLARERGLAPAGTVGYDGGSSPARSQNGSDAMWSRVEYLIGQKVDPKYREMLGAGKV